MLKSLQQSHINSFYQNDLSLTLQWILQLYLVWLKWNVLVQNHYFFNLISQHDYLNIELNPMLLSISTISQLTLALPYGCSNTYL